MTTFDNADEAYVAWLESHPEGYILNTERKPRPDYLILHRATCKHVTRTAEPPVRWTSAAYIKVCADNTSDIERWCRDIAGGSPQPCGHCRPTLGG